MEYPIKNPQALQKHATQAVDTLELPFWDDFSSSSLIPDSTLWLYGINVNVNPGRGLRPPSLQVATFDGTDVNGVPYSTTDERGPADSLVSQPINLGNIDIGLRNTLYFSFFWQKRGLGEIPEKVDSIRLQFKDTNGQWITQWSAIGGDTSQTASFKQELVQVPPGPFQHASFQFRFQSFGKLTGGYDNWHIDYILLRTRRNDQDYYVRDRTLSTPPTSIFKDFRAIPFEHYCERAGSFTDSTTVEGFSLEPPVGFPSSIRFGAQILNASNGVIIDEMNNTSEDGLLFNGQNFITLQANGIDTSALIAAKSAEGVEIITKFFIRSKDSLLFDYINTSGDSVFFDNVDLAVNDTARAHISLGRHYAYDDGSAETGAGVNRINGKLAYLYALPVQDTLTAVDIYFPNTESDQANESVRLSIWTRLGDEEQLIHSQTLFIELSDTLDEFTNFPLSKALLVKDSLFIGIQQLGEKPIVIGLDKNGDSGDKMYFNTAGVWEANTSISGNLMLRPIFGSTDDVITNLPEPAPQEKLVLYPNPLMEAKVQIRGDVRNLKEVRVVDLTGREIPSRFDKLRKVIEFSPVNKGIYVVQLHTSTFIQIEKLILLDR
ncbi:MAG: T9SS type A sorting domain-containing protein [Cyclobacteriaceae bacterium]|nr:T9SS type A sorting domain-containing protein [Cyclobacteriaceae bacterium]